MSPEPLPLFRYHLDPVASGTVVASAVECVCCRRARGYIYIGPVYAREDYDDRICPWCIADGSAHRSFGVEFVARGDVGLGGEWDERVAEAVIDEVTRRTPGFMGWEQDRWWTHCGDAAQFIGKVGHAELTAAGPEAIAAVRAGSGVGTGDAWEALFAAADKHGSPRAYLFRCSRCGKFGGYLDCD